jgi:isopenicillin N synthase-like dioxygenase
MNDTKTGMEIPVIDIAPLVGRTGKMSEVAAGIGRACRDLGFFYVVGHGVDESLQQRLEELSRRFFAQDAAQKMAIAMERGGRAWRGYFPVGGELTSGRPDLKEGIYFGAELGEDHALVRAGAPLHGPNLFPSDLPGFRPTVLEYIGAMTRLGHRLMAGIALSLGLDESYFEHRYTAEPLTLFRIFHYPASEDEESWGVGEHTDYGLLTMLKQDEAGGLEIKSRGRWIEAPPVAGSFVCNIGDMLDRMTGGLYRSTPHRARNRSAQGRLSFPFFFDPNWEAEVQSIGLHQEIVEDRDERWDRASVHEFRGTYGEYLLGKVGKVFPDLGREVLPGG